MGQSFLPRCFEALIGIRYFDMNVYSIYVTNAILKSNLYIELNKYDHHHQDYLQKHSLKLQAEL